MKSRSSNAYVKIRLILSISETVLAGTVSKLVSLSSGM